MFLCDTERRQWSIKPIRISLYLNKQTNVNDHKTQQRKVLLLFFCDIWSCALVTPRRPSKNVCHGPGLVVAPFFWVFPALPHPQGTAGGSLPFLTQRISMHPSLPFCSATLPLTPVVPLSLSFRAPWHYFYYSLAVCKNDADILRGCGQSWVKAEVSVCWEAITPPPMSCFKDDI